MATDRYLSASFDLSDLPGWRDATEAEAEGARELASHFLEPIARRWGRVAITSWLRSTGSGAHLDPGTADVVPLDATLTEVHLWATRELAGTFGELIEELPSAGEITGHIHRTRWGVGGFGESLREVSPGVFEPVAAWELPPFGDPVERRVGWWGLLIVALAFLADRVKR
jgi:hypothetical protein